MPRRSHRHCLSSASSLALNDSGYRRCMEGSGRNVVVSGGGTGIGYAVARRFMLAGDDVVIVGRRRDVLAEASERLNAEAGRAAVRGVAADMTNVSDVEAFAETAPSSVDVLVNNAGGVVSTPDRSLGDVEADWVAQFRANVLTAVLLTTALEPRLRRPGS